MFYRKSMTHYLWRAGSQTNNFKQTELFHCVTMNFKHTVLLLYSIPLCIGIFPISMRRLRRYDNSIKPTHWVWNLKLNIFTRLLPKNKEMIVKEPVWPTNMPIRNWHIDLLACPRENSMGTAVWLYYPHWHQIFSIASTLVSFTPL